MTTLSATRSGAQVRIPNRDKSVPETVPELSPTPDTSAPPDAKRSLSHRSVSVSLSVPLLTRRQGARARRVRAHARTELCALVAYLYDASYLALGTYFVMKSAGFSSSRTCPMSTVPRSLRSRKAW
jgi:hypothetical protein